MLKYQHHWTEKTNIIQSAALHDHHSDDVDNNIKLMIGFLEGLKEKQNSEIIQIIQDQTNSSMIYSMVRWWDAGSQVHKEFPSLYIYIYIYIWSHEKNTLMIPSKECKPLIITVKYKIH